MKALDIAACAIASLMFCQVRAQGVVAQWPPGPGVGSKATARRLGTGSTDAAAGNDRRLSGVTGWAAMQQLVLTEDSGTTCHAYFTASGLADTKGCAWQVVGALKVAAIGNMTGRAFEAGPFSDYDYIRLPTINDVLDYAGDFTCSMVFTPWSIRRVNRTLIANGSYGASGEGWLVNAVLYGAGALFDTYASGSAFTESTSSTQLPLHRASIVTFGRASGVQYIKANGGTTASTSAAKTTAGVNSYAKLGPGFDGTIREIMCSSTAYNETAAQTLHGLFAANVSAANDWTGAPAPLLDCRNYIPQQDWACLGATLTKGGTPRAYPSGYCGSGLGQPPDSAAVSDGSTAQWYGASAGTLPAQTGDFAVAAIVQAASSVNGPVIGRTFSGNQWSISQAGGRWTFGVWSASSSSTVDIGAVVIGKPSVIIASYTNATGSVAASVDGTAIVGAAVFPINPVTPYFAIGGNVATYWPGTFTRVTVWQHAIAPFIQQQMYTNATQRLGCPSHMIVALGDSITWGFNTSTPYTTSLRFLLGANMEIGNEGMFADVTSNMVTRWHAGIRGTATTLVLMGGVNDVLNGGSGSAAWANLRTIVDEAYSDGTRVVLLTVLPCKNFSTWSTDKQTELDSLNAAIRAYTSKATIIDTYAAFGDTDARALLSALDSGDGLHPNQRGANQLADLVYSALAQ